MVDVIIVIPLSIHHYFTHIPTCVCVSAQNLLVGKVIILLVIIDYQSAAVWEIQPVQYLNRWTLVKKYPHMEMNR